MQRKQIRVYSIGIGSDTSVPIPVAQEDGVTQYLEDEEGEQLTTQFDETTLRMVADMTGGRYFRSTTGHELADFIGETNFLPGRIEAVSSGGVEVETSWGRFVGLLRRTPA